MNSGSGKLLRRRRCLYPPCEGQSTEMNLDLECENGQASDDQGKTCFHNNGLGFHAKVTEKKCINWNVANHPYYRSDYYHELEENYCRNPGGERNAPWCFVDKDLSWKYCLSTPPCQSLGLLLRSNRLKLQY